MCELYARQDPQLFARTTRSLRLNGQSTSIRLENVFWSVLERIATAEGASVPDFIAALHDEVTAGDGVPANFTSILRSSCVLHLERGGSAGIARSSAAA